MLALLQDLDGIQLTKALLEVVLTFAHTINGLSHLPGANDILNPAIHTAARSFLAMSAANTAQAAQPPLAPTQDINNDNTSSSIDMQGPQPTNLHVKACPASPAAVPQSVLKPACTMPAQQANLSAPGTPVNNYNSFMPFNSLMEGDISMRQAPFGVQGPHSKRLRTDSIKAQRARASGNAQNILDMVSMPSTTTKCQLVACFCSTPS